MNNINCVMCFKVVETEEDLVGSTGQSEAVTVTQLIEEDLFAAPESTRQPNGQRVLDINAKKTKQNSTARPTRLDKIKRKRLEEKKKEAEKKRRQGKNKEL